MRTASIPLCASVVVALLTQSARAAQYLWQTNSAGDDVHVVDLSTRESVKRLLVGPEPHGIAAPDDARVVYISVETNGRQQGELIAVDPRTYAITFRLAVGPEPHEIDCTPDGRWVYVPCRDGHYWVIDAVEKRVAKRIRTGGRPHNTRASRDGHYMYLSPKGAPKRVTVVDVHAGHEVVGEIPFRDSIRPPAIDATGRFFYQHVDGLNGFQVADLSTRRVVATVEHGHSLGWFLAIGPLGWLTLDGFKRCHGLEVRPDQGEIWSCCGDRVNVHDLRRPAFPEVASIPIMDEVYWITFSPDGRYAFAAVSAANKVAVIDSQSRRVVSYLSVGERPKRNLVIELPRDE